jgi:hypothetical protein
MTDQDDSTKPELLPCPFCGGAPHPIEIGKRLGYGEYESHVTFLAITCGLCLASSSHIVKPTMHKFTEYTVQDFRQNPALRAKEEDGLESKINEVKKEMAEQWNRRA